MSQEIFNKNNQIISLPGCKQILNSKANTYTDEEIIRIRDFLIVLAEIQFEQAMINVDKIANKLK